MNFEKHLENFGKYLKKDKIKIVNPQKMKDVMEMYKILISMIDIECEDVSIEVRDGALELGDVYIRIEAPQFTSYDMAALANTLSNADNIDIYPTADQRIKLDVMFNHVYYVSTL